MKSHRKAIEKTHKISEVSVCIARKISEESFNMAHETSKESSYSKPTFSSGFCCSYIFAHFLPRAIVFDNIARRLKANTHPPQKGNKIHKLFYYKAFLKQKMQSFLT